MAQNNKKIIIILFEGTVFVFVFSLFIHLITSSAVNLRDILISLSIVLFSGALTLYPLSKKWNSRRQLLAVSAALAGGFWMFSFFRYIGYVKWPLSSAPDLGQYLLLLYYHFILAVTVLAPVLLVRYVTGSNKRISWGSWRRFSDSSFIKSALIFSIAGCWLFALYTLFQTKPNASGPVAGFIVVCVIKAILTGATEEICYRGIIQQVAVKRYGVFFGIIFQSCLYTAFHMHLGEAFLPGAGFLMGVMTLGLVFGIVTHFTSGIGWSSIIHMAINVVIEWQNLS